MSKDYAKKIYKLAQSSGIDKITVITNHLKISGTIYLNEDKDDEILTLTNARIWRLKDVCTCNTPECKCNESTFCALDWLNVNLDKMLAFSLIKD